jgi:hypothetical protein
MASCQKKWHTSAAPLTIDQVGPIHYSEDEDDEHDADAYQDQENFLCVSYRCPPLGLSSTIVRCVLHKSID